MKNVGVRFHDGSEVAYYGSNKINTGADEFFRVIRMEDPDGAITVIAELLAADVKDVFEVELEEEQLA